MWGLGVWDFRVSGFLGAQGHQGNVLGVRAVWPCDRAFLNVADPDFPGGGPGTHRKAMQALNPYPISSYTIQVGLEFLGVLGDLSHQPQWLSQLE